MLEIDSLSVSYGSNLAVGDVSLSVTHGEIVALIGPNGAGKSSLMGAVGGLVRIQSGRVTYNNRDITELTDNVRARLLAVVPQARVVGGAFSVEQTVLLGRTAHMNWLGQAGDEDLGAVQWAMQAVQIDHLSKRRNAELSGGELQRVFLARALAQSTPVLLMDEPTNHLDLRHQIDFLSIVRDLAKKENKAVLMAMHDLNLVSKYADRIALIVNGRLIELGTPAEVLTAEKIGKAYQTDIEVFNHPNDGNPLIFA